MAHHKLVTLQQTSAALKAEKRADVLAPAEPREDGSPVLILLHGFGGSRRTWTESTRLLHHLHGADLLVVMPESGRRWFVNDHAGHRYEDYLIEELIPLVRRSFPVAADRRFWAVGGFSMGGASALMQALRHPELFSAVVSHAGAFEGPLRRGDPYAALRGRAELLMPSEEVHERVWGPHDSATRTAYDPYRLLAARRADLPLSVYADVGLDDYDRIIAMNRNVATALRSAGVELTYHERAGGHDLDFLDDALGRSLEFLAAKLGARPPDPSPRPDPGRPSISGVTVPVLEPDSLLAGGPVREQGGETVQARFARQVARTPDAVAVECGPDRLTYAELFARAGELSRRLRRHGVGPDSVVGLCLHRGVDLVVGMLGIIRAGGAYLPMDPAYPAERLRFMLATADARAVVTSRALADVAHRAGVGRARVLIDELPADPAPAPASADAAPSSADPVPQSGSEPGSGENALYVVFTSGSTGRPKGVTVPHRALLNLFDWYLPDTGMGPSDTQLGTHSVSFDPAALEILFPLLNGARLVVSADGVHADTDALLSLIAEAEATVINIGPSTLRRLLDEPDGADRMRSLRIVVSGGERLPPELRDKFLAVLPEARLVNHYGPTETTVFATSWDCTAADGAVVPIGSAVGGAGVYVLDDALTPVAPGAVGELHIGGAGVARCYASMPRLTAEAFLPDPFSGIPGSRMYSTGDRVRFLADGVLEFLGRGDDQVKVRGYRVEIGEVEATICRHPAVREAAVVVHDAGAGSSVLAAFVEHDGSADLESVRAHLRQYLPEHMIPGHLELVDALPRTVTGKVDKNGLTGPIVPDADAAPRDEVERILAEIWAGVLALPRVGVHDDFFALGGDSLLATRVVARARRELGWEIPLIVLFERRSVAAVAAALRPDGAVAVG